MKSAEFGSCWKELHTVPPLSPPGRGFRTSKLVTTVSAPGLLSYFPEWIDLSLYGPRHRAEG